VKFKLSQALIGGFVGTVLVTLMGMFVAPKVIGQPMDVAALIAPLLAY
jgi:cystathionine beta-lyase family protein involved in aluminum resistance